MGVLRTFLPRSATAKIAVVRIFSWYVIWHVAASRLLAAMNRRLFWIMYINAGTPTW